MRYLACLAVVLLTGSVRAEDYVIDGAVKSVDWTRYTVTILRENGKETTVQITRQTEVRKDGKLVEWRAIRVKQEVRCVFNLDTKEASHFGIYETIDRPAYRPR